MLWLTRLMTADVFLGFRATVIVVKDNGKETVYYFDKESGKKNHKAICTEAKKGTVKGTVKKEGDKMVVTVKEIKFED